MNYNLEQSGELDLGASGELKLDGGDSDVMSDDDEELSFGASSILLASESSKKLKGDETGSDILDGEPEKGESSSDTGKLLADDDLVGGR